jgi:2-isopropylmalate synthase
MEVFETTLRDGEQQALVHFSPEQKGELAAVLEALGVDAIDAGFPAASAVDLKGVQQIASVTERVGLSVLRRPFSEDFRDAYMAVADAAPRARVATAARPLDLVVARAQGDVKQGRKKTLLRSQELMSEARTWFSQAQYYLTCAGNRDRSFLADLAAAVAQAGATYVVVADTLSTMEPYSVGRLVAEIKGRLPSGTILGVHCHYLLGLGLANSVAGVASGATQVEVTVGNLGEAGGNTALEQVLAYAAQFAREDPRFDTKCRLDRVNEVATRVSTLAGISFPSNQPLIGEDSFRIKTGIHQSFPPEVAAAAFAPERVGRSLQVVLGWHSGIAGIMSRLKEIGIGTSGLNPHTLYHDVMEHAMRLGVVTDLELRGLAERSMSITGREDAPRPVTPIDTHDGGAFRHVPAPSPPLA